ncbi:MAG: ATP-binding protein [Sarcina sp.]
MNNYIKKSLLKLLLILVVLVLLFGGSVSLISQEEYFNDITNSCRVLVSNQLNDILNNGENIEETYKYTIISLDGTVIKSTEKNLEEKIFANNLLLGTWEEIASEGLIRYSTPLIVEGTIENIVIFSIPKEDILEIRNDINYKRSYNIMAILIFMGIICIVYKIYKLVKNDVLEPIDKMHKSAKEILKGNYSEKISYDYYGEIGEFSHDFESMRDNLVNASEKEKALKIAEKELLACISHDLKTPIANITGYCEGILDGVVKEEKDIKRYAGIILKKSRVLAKLLDDILELSKAEINQMSINKKEIYTEEFFLELLEEISIDIVSSGRSFEFDGEIPNMLLNMDKDKIGQAINNIISNAIKYTSNNGIINIKFNKIHEGIEINIKDNGIGIATEEVSLVFNKFYRSEKHRNQNIQGSGLGLSIAKYIVEMHNGNIEMISDKGIGTTVIIKIRN